MEVFIVMFGVAPYIEIKVFDSIDKATDFSKTVDFDFCNILIRKLL